MRIYLTRVFVEDQAAAEKFYTEVLGFRVKHDIPLGDARWLTVVSPDAPDGTELLLEPNGHPAVGPYTKALVADGIPAASFAVDDVRAECDRLQDKGVRFTQPPTDMGEVTTAVFDDTCGNLIQIVQLPAGS
ncbi:VOC family protein [Flexivirga meconopsidis]|uniref:VOC family protein n=1 Tax=Flexivirga meconopsidis TaxID=2977121 RepID=UPI00223ED4A7|nr:VOC family protein [Flexivirga meconopsidis]